MRDPYQVLGVGRDTSADDIKQAYRRLAKQYHPDLNPGRSDIEHRFKEISSAYGLLSDPVKRARFDKGEIDAGGNERFDRNFRRHGARTQRRPGGDPFGGGINAEDIFADLFGAGRRRTGPGAGPGVGGAAGGTKTRGGDINYSVTVSFVEAAQGVKRRVSLSNGKSIDVTVPPGTIDQQKLRLRGQGLDGAAGGPAGDAIIEIHVESHPLLSRSGLDINLEIPVSLPEAVLGATIKVPTLGGTVALKVPPGSNTGTLLRLKGKGIHDEKKKLQGDQYVTLKLVLPDPPDPELTQFIEKWAKHRTYDPRKKLGIG
ncbi:MAG: DnaJ domain-containing protein [Azospirillum sp.]|nr:DnaJ domain-containing protein [Azospirillum sp.]